MFTDDFLSISLAEVLGLLVTLLGIWLVVRQLNEAKLASQMEGLLTLGNQFTELQEKRTIMRNSERKDWNSLSPEEAYTRVWDDPELKSAYIEIGNHFDLVGTLVSANALSYDMAAKMYKSVVPPIYERLEKVIQVDRIKLDDPFLY